MIPLLDELEAKARDLQSGLYAIKAKVKAEKLRIIIDKFNVNIGSVVRGRDGKEYQVVEISTDWFPDKPWITCNPRKKNGEFGIAQRNLYDCWELVE